IETTLRVRDRVLGEALLDYWARLVRDYRSGKKLLAQLTEEDWFCKQEVGWKLNGMSYLISPSNPDGHVWALRLLYQQLHTSDDPHCLSPDKLNEHPAVPYGFLKQSTGTPLPSLLQHSSLTEAQSLILSSRNI